MFALERPRLRSHLYWERENGGGYAVSDLLRLAVPRLRLTNLEMSWLHLFNGQRALGDIQTEAVRNIDGLPGAVELFHGLVQKLDDALFFEGPRFRTRLRQHADNPIRPPSCTASYGSDPVLLRHCLDNLFAAPAASGRPGPHRPDPHFRAALVPHIDYARGGCSYTWAYKEVFERSAAALFVIVGTSHYSCHRFTLTRKHFQTPLGIARTDQTYIDRLVAHYGDGLFDDELPAHVPEHSIELEVVFLQYLFADRPFRIVPLLVGSFHDCIELEREPIEANDIGRMIAALRSAERETNEPICYIISGDLAHLGPKFGDANPLDSSRLADSRCQDLALLHELGIVGWASQPDRQTGKPDGRAGKPNLQVADSRCQDFALLHELGIVGWASQPDRQTGKPDGRAGKPNLQDAGVKKPRRSCPPDAAAYFRLIAGEGDARRICGLPPTYTVLEALHPSRGEVLHYDQYAHPDGSESVSFASVVFYK